jgi:hypothetical protein
MMEFEGKDADLAEEFFSDAKREVPLWLYRVILVVYVLSIVVLVVAGIGMVSIFIDIDLRGAGKLALAGLVVSVMVLIVFSHLKDSCKGVSKTEMAIKCGQLGTACSRKIQAIAKLHGPSAVVIWRNQTDFVHEPAFGTSWSELRERRDWRQARIDDIMHYANSMLPTAKL